MSVQRIMMDDVRFSSFHTKMTLYTGGGAFCDGYILGIVAVALEALTPALKLTTVEAGLISSGLLVGMFFGSLIFGYVTDIIGRKLMFVLNLVAFVVGSVLQFFVTDFTQLLILRVFLGIAVGADYPIATSLLAEFSPKKNRGMLLSILIGLWWVGFVGSYAVGAVMISLGPDSWRWMLASSAVPAAILLIARLDCPESPRWLIEKGRTAEARAILDKHLGKDVDIQIPERVSKTSFASIFRGGYMSRTVFCCLFWVLQSAPGSAIAMFIPKVLANFHLAQGGFKFTGSLIIGLFYLVGLLPGIFLVEKMGRRPVVVWPFIGQAVLLAILALMTEAQPWTILLVFSVYAVLHTGTTVVQWVYPNELFPTEVRATAVGFAAAISRGGMFAGTFFMPILLNNIGLESTLFISGGIYFIGFIVSYFMAPETKNIALDEAAAVKQVSAVTEQHPELQRVRD